jgi:hypothetical protein
VHTILSVEFLKKKKGIDRLLLMTQSYRLGIDCGVWLVYQPRNMKQISSRLDIFICFFIHLFTVELCNDLFEVLLFALFDSILCEIFRLFTWGWKICVYLFLKLKTRAIRLRFDISSVFSILIFPCTLLTFVLCLNVEFMDRSLYSYLIQRINEWLDSIDKDQQILVSQEFDWFILLYSFFSHLHFLSLL